MKKVSLTVLLVLIIAAVSAVSGCVSNPGTVDYDPFAVYKEEVSEYKDKYEGAYANTVYAARDLANGVNVYYLSGERNAVRIANAQMNVNYSIGSGSVTKQITSLTSPEGSVYLENTGDAFIELTDGTVYTTAAGIETPELNSYRHGSYYYDTHIVNNSFARASDSDNKIDFPLTEPNMTQMVSGVKLENGIVSFKIDDPEDPYIGWSGLSIDADSYTGLRITMKNNTSLLCEVYVAAGSFSTVNADQRTSFGLLADGEYHEYTISLENIMGYKGNLKQLRLDFDKAKNDNISISKIEFLPKDNTRPGALLDRTFHAFTDKINSVDRFFITGNTENVAAIGMLTRIRKDRVGKLVVKDKSGLHDNLVGVDWESAEYAGFDINDAGVFGYILLSDKYCGTISVCEDGDDYVIKQQYVPAEGVLRKKIVYEVGRRLYADGTHSFDAFQREAEFERNPLKTVKSTGGKGAYAGYDKLRGMYVFSIEEVGGFSHAYYETPDLHGRLSIQLTGDDADRTVYVCTHAGGGSLECAVLLEKNDTVLPVAMEVCKNFGGDDGSSLFYPEDVAFSDTFFPLAVEAGKETDVTVLNLYQNWGKYPLKQISSIRFFTTYYHLSTGVTETNCIAPYFVYGKDYWTIPDFRPMSAPLWASQPQHTSGGCPRVLQYTSSDQGFSGLEFTTKYIDSTGPAYADVRMNYLSEDGRIGVSYRHVEMPQTDESRAYYEVEFKVLEDIPIEEFRRDFTIYSMDGRFVFYKNLGYLDSNNEPAVTETNISGDKKYYVLGKKCPYISIFGVNSADYVNMAVLVADSDITIGGKKFTGNFMVSDYASWDLNRVGLTLDLGKVTLRAGDVMKFRIIILPFGSQDEGDERVRIVRENTCLNPIVATSETDTVLPDKLVPKVKSTDGKTCEFTISGGAANVPPLNEAYYKTCDYNISVRAYGFESFGVPEIYEKVNGEWVRYEVASANGYDGYAAFTDFDNSFSYAFVVTMNEAQQRTFKVVAGGSSG